MIMINIDVDNNYCFWDVVEKLKMFNKPITLFCHLFTLRLLTTLFTLLVHNLL